MALELVLISGCPSVGSWRCIYVISYCCIIYVYVRLFEAQDLDHRSMARGLCGQYLEGEPVFCAPLPAVIRTLGPPSS